MSNNKTKSLATKVTLTEDEMIHNIIDEFNRCHNPCMRDKTVYDLLKSTVIFLIRMMDKPHGLSQREEYVLAHLKEILNHPELLIAPHDGLELKLEEATVYMNQEDGKGVIGAHIGQEYFGKREITYNIQYIVDKPINMLMPDLYKTLRRVAVELGCSDLLETIHRLVIEHDDRQALADISEEFSDNDRHEYGNKQSDIRKYKGKYNKQIK